MNWLDRSIASVAPGWAWKRVQLRAMLSAYEAATASRLRKFSRNTASGEAISQAETQALRTQARHLDRNHDIAHGALNILVNNTVGPNGIGIEPQPRSVSGEIIVGLAEQLLELWRDFMRHPEVTFQHNGAQMQRLAARTMFRDGEGFCNMLQGAVPFLNHRTQVPLSLELLEPDFVPTENEIFVPDRMGGIVRNQWGEPKAYRVFKRHPGDMFNFKNPNDMKTVSADSMLHYKLVDRIGQSRGVSAFASVITRLEDLKDYEESERIAAKIAASMAAYIKKGMPELYANPTDDEGNVTPRALKFQPGMIIDDLAPGEDIGTIDTNRPNPNLVYYRDGQLRAVSSGIGASYSSISRNYDGSYSAQRQEMVEQWANYAAFTGLFVSQFLQPVWERFVSLANLAGLLDIPADIAPGSLDDAMFIGPQMPWIDPFKEAKAFELLEEGVWLSGPEIIRRRGGNPKDVLDQESKWQAALREARLGKSYRKETKPAGGIPREGE